jgi:beta-1,4-mannosyltransferase
VNSVAFAFACLPQVSSTSWTPDEDFGLLFEALRLYDAAACADADAEQRPDAPPPLSRRWPRLLVVVTGSGPLRARYEAAAAAARLRHVAIRTAWLEAADYPRLLASADLGVSLHASSCGLDLPMKARRASSDARAMHVCAIA